MDYKCDEPGCDFVAHTPASLGSHKRYKHKIRKPESNSDRLCDLLDKIELKVGSSNLSKCPVCGSPLELMLNGPGIYKLKCSKCYEEEG